MRKQAIDAAIDVRNPSLAVGDGTSLAAERLTLRARLGDAFGSPAGTAELRVTRATADELAVTQLDLKADGNARALRVTLTAGGTRGHPLRSMPAASSPWRPTSSACNSTVSMAASVP